MLKTTMMEPFLPKIPLILVVDDDRSTRNLLKIAMEEEGYQVIEAKNGQECLAEYNRYHPDMVLLDAVMPEMDGFICCQQLRQLPNGHQIPILMITALDDQDSIDQAFAVGAIDYVTKPIHWAVLAQRVKRLLATSKTLNQLEQIQQQLQQQQAWVSLFQSLSVQLVSGESLFVFLPTILTQVRILAQVERIVLCQRGDLFRLESVAPGYPSTETLSWQTLSFEAYYQTEYQQGKAIVIEELQRSYLPPEAINPLIGKQTCAAVILPMSWQGTLWGWLCLHRCQTAEPYTPNELEQLSCLSHLLLLLVTARSATESSQPLISPRH